KEADVLQVRFTMVDAYRKSGDIYRTAILGEHLAREWPKTKQGAPAAAFALDAFRRGLIRNGQLVVEQGNKVNELKQAIGTMGDNHKLKVELDVAERDLARFQEFARTDNERLIAMAQVIEKEKAWEAYPLHNLARHWRGLALLALGDYKAAILAL